MAFLTKALNNIFSTRAFFTLGAANYLRLIVSLLVTFPGILRTRSLRPLDKRMGKSAALFHRAGRPFRFDCHFCDTALPEESFAFGIARELYIRDCYFRWHDPSVFEKARVVVDLGANRGGFSSLMTLTAKRILCVECRSQYRALIEHNMRENHFEGFSIESAFIGAGGNYHTAGTQTISMEELLLRHDVAEVDFLKMDIEGSEFQLFEHADWLKKVKALSMELHPEFGDSENIVAALKTMGFGVILADENLSRLNDSRGASFLYAAKRSPSR